MLSSSLSNAVVNPSAPTTIENLSVTTTAYPQGSVLNLTRGNIYTVQINESQATRKWVGVVGNISGEFALQDSDGDALYDWSITTVTGEVYATRETTSGTGWSGGGIPQWSEMECANSSLIEDEGLLFNSTYYGNASKVYSEDSLKSTFTDFEGTWPVWYAGDKLITDDANGVNPAEDCYAIELNENNTDTTDDDWLEIIMTDNTTETESDLPIGMNSPSLNYDIVYAALIENHSFGYNGEIYDFQMILPQLGQSGTVTVVPYYFYVELS